MHTKSNHLANGHKGTRPVETNGIRTTKVAAPGGDRLPRASRTELEQLVEVLKSVKQGDFGVRVPPQKDEMLNRVGELLNDIIGMNEHMSGELVRVGKVVGQEGKIVNALLG
jgi:hypothetical protein